MIYIGLFLNIAPDAGWFSYVPLAGPEYSPGKRSDFWAQMVTFTELSALGISVLQHLTLLGTSLLFWASLLPRRATNRARILAVFSLFTTTIQTTLLGALLTLSPRIWYPSYGDAAPGGLRRWKISSSRV